MKKNIIAVIPARYGSTRFPGKPLALLHGKPIIQWVISQAVAANCFSQIVVATDDERIKASAEEVGAKAVMTDPNLPSGSDRVWAVAKEFDTDLIMNLQGDEPFINPEHLVALVEAFTAQQNPAFDIGTLVTPITEPHEMSDPNVVKAVFTEHKAHYFSRSAIPFERGPAPNPLGWRHIGIYLYTREALRHFVSLPPSPLEQVEQLEQLRALESEMDIFVYKVDKAPLGVDTPEDLRQLEDAPIPSVRVNSK